MQCINNLSVPEHLFQHPELLANSNKSKWMVFGESLLVQADGQMFRHILNFLRCDRLLLPLDFRWGTAFWMEMKPSLWL